MSTPTTDPLVARWPHRQLVGVPVSGQTRTRDAATAAALEAYLTAGRQIPSSPVIRL